MTSSPAWERTLLVINYDEWGGFFDHLAPSVSPDANPEWGLRGFRVPCLIISPRAHREYVAHDVYDHTSVLKAVEWRWGLAPLTPPNLTAPRWNVPPFAGQPCALASTSDYEQWYALRDLALSNGWSLP